MTTKQNTIWKKENRAWSQTFVLHARCCCCCCCCSLSLGLTHIAVMTLPKTLATSNLPKRVCAMCIFMAMWTLKWMDLYKCFKTDVNINLHLALLTPILNFTFHLVIACAIRIVLRTNHIEIVLHLKFEFGRQFSITLTCILNCIYLVERFMVKFHEWMSVMWCVFLCNQKIIQLENNSTMQKRTSGNGC